MLKNCFKILAIVLLLAPLGSCKKKEVLPIITTLRPCLITDVTATCGGVVYNDGKSSITERGLVYSDFSSLPEITHTKIKCGMEGSNFTADLTDLKPKTKYYLRSYAINSEGISYGETVTFTTYSISPYPEVHTNESVSFGVNHAICSGVVIPGQPMVITEYGICYSKSTSNPKISDSRLQCFSSSHNFTGQLQNLEPNSVYYYRAYAINSAGAGYGLVNSFKTYNGLVADIDGHTYYTVKIGNQEWMAQNLRVSKYRDGSVIDAPIGNTNWNANVFGACAQYNDAPFNENTYGKLYNWHAVNNPSGLAPAGWHIPTQAEWLTLLNYCNSNDISQAGVKLSEKGSSHWANGGGTNDFSFNMLPGGVRGSEGYHFLSQVGSFWTSTSVNTTFASMYSYGSTQATMSDVEKYYGCSIRCVKD